MNTSGLLLFTNNGDIANALMHPSSKIKRVYEVSIKNNITKEKIILSKKGIDIGKGEIGKFSNIVDVNSKLTNTYKVTLATGKNREIRRVFNSLDCKVVKLKRIKYALVELSNLKVNKYRILNREEMKGIIKYLKNN